jgi:hypothetical protein
MTVAHLTVICIALAYIQWIFYERVMAAVNAGNQPSKIMEFCSLACGCMFGSMLLMLWNLH